MSQDGPVRIAMWSGPRNISTAMMRAWANRPDTFVIDEPFYAFYLRATGKKHPGADEIMEAGETDWRKVVEQCGRRLSAPTAKKIFYQKQMTHHLLPEIDLEWLVGMTNCFLIRDPREVILSYIKKQSNPMLEDLGFVQQAEIFDWVRARTGSIPPVIDASDVLQNPERILQLLCTAVAIEFDESMLSWPSGLRETDGVWARYWYGEVAKSTSFQPYKPREGIVPDRLHELHEQCREYYERLYEYRLH
jgi:sulfotransferase family protein